MAYTNEELSIMMNNTIDDVKEIKNKVNGYDKQLTDMKIDIAWIKNDSKTTLEIVKELKQYKQDQEKDSIDTLNKFKKKIFIAVVLFMIGSASGSAILTKIFS